MRLSGLCEASSCVVTMFSISELASASCKNKVSSKIA